MDNPEEVLHSLDEYSKLKPNDIPRELEDYLLYVAKTGDPVFQWTFVKCLFRDKLSNTIIEFYETSPTLELPECPNVDIFNYESMKSNLVERLESFNSAPFTIQRLCELLTTPRKEYMRVDKFMRAIEKNILVVSTKEPGNTRRNAKNSQTELLVNGVERGLDLGEAVETASSFDVGVTHPYDNEVPINNTNKVDCSSTKGGVTEGYADSSTANDWEKESESSSKLKETESCDNEDQPINGGSVQNEGANAPQLNLSHIEDLNKVTLNYSDETVGEAKLTSDCSPDSTGQNILSRELTSLDFPTSEMPPVTEGEVISTESTNPSGMVPPADQIQVIPSVVSDDGFTSETPAIEDVLFHKPSSDDQTSIIKSSRVIFCGTSEESETTQVEHSTPETVTPTSNKENEDSGKTALDVDNLGVCEQSEALEVICSDGATEQTILEEPVSMTVSDSGYIIVETIEENISLAVQLTEEEDSSKHSILVESPTAVAEMYAPPEELSPVVEAEDVEGNGVAGEGAKQVMEQEAMEVDEGSLDEPMDQDDQHVEAQNQS